MNNANAQEAEDTMWQGYVSAISCLLLALLLIMAILAISLMLASAAENAAARLQGDSSAKPVMPRAASPNTVQSSSPAHSAKGARWVLNFPGQTVSLGHEQRAQFAAQLASAKNQGGWQVFAYSEPGNSTSQRLAYIRVLATRDLLIESGVDPLNIELQLLDTDTSLSRGKSTSAHAPAPESMVYVKLGRSQEVPNTHRKVQP